MRRSRSSSVSCPHSRPQGSRSRWRPTNRFRTTRVLEVIARVDSPNLGICIDPANSVAALDSPREVIDAVAPYARNIHVKDFAFSRQAGWVGFTYAGARLGEGLLDYDYLVEQVRPHERGINQIIEHWLVWQGDSETTCRLEDDWTLHNLDYLRRKAAAHRISA